jgi:hypothetical protein
MLWKVLIITSRGNKPCAMGDLVKGIHAMGPNGGDQSTTVGASTSPLLMLYVVATLGACGVEATLQVAELSVWQIWSNSPFGEQEVRTTALHSGNCCSDGRRLNLRRNAPRSLTLPRWCAGITQQPL